MIPETDMSSVPSMPGDDSIANWLQSRFGDEKTGVRFSGKKSLFLDADAEGGCPFLRGHVFFEVSADGKIFGDEIRSGPRSVGRSAPCAFDGREIMLLSGEERERNIGKIFRAEGLLPDTVAPEQLAHFFYDIYGAWRGQILNPTLSGNADTGWSVSYRCLRWHGGCIPSQPDLYQYNIKISPQLDVTFNEISLGLEKKYCITVINRREENGIQYGNPRRDFNEDEVQTLVAALGDEFAGTRAEAINALRQLNMARGKKDGSRTSLASVAIPALFKCLGDMDKLDCAGRTFRGIEGDVVSTVCQLIRETEVTDEIRAYAPALMPSLRDKHLRYGTILALKYMRPDGANAEEIIEVINWLRGRDQSEWGRRTYAQNSYFDADWVDLIAVLGVMQPPAKGAEHFLEGLIASDADAATKDAAKKSLAAINL